MPGKIVNESESETECVARVTWSKAETGMSGERFELTWRERSEADPEAVADRVAEDGVERRKFGCRQDVEQVERKRDRLAVAEVHINHRKGEERASISVFKTAHHQRSP